MSLMVALRDGTHREQLVAMRDFLAEQLEQAPFREVGPIAAQLRAVLADLDAMPLTGEASVVDELERQRAARRAAANAS